MTEGDAPAEQPESAGSSGSGRRVALTGVVLALIAALLWGGYWWWTRDQVSTDDAFIRAHILQVAPRISGQVAHVWVDDNETVARGERLFSIDAEPFQTRLDQAQAKLDAARADKRSAARDLALARATTQTDVAAAKARLNAAQARAERMQTEAKRYRSLAKSNSTSQQRLDRAETSARVAKRGVAEAKAKLAKAQTAPQQIALKKAKVAAARSSVEQARSRVEQAKLDLSYTVVKAAHAGQIAKKSITPGSQVSAGEAAMALVQTGRWVIANFKETQLGEMAVGQPVSVAVDALPKRTFAGHVQSIQAGTGPTFSLLPPENATGNFVKVVKRVPVKIVFNKPARIDGLHLVPGMSVVPTVDVSGDGAKREAARAVAADK